MITGRKGHQSKLLDQVTGLISDELGIFNNNDRNVELQSLSIYTMI